MAAVLCWHVQIFVDIPSLERWWEEEYSLNFDCEWNCEWNRLQIWLLDLHHVHKFAYQTNENLCINGVFLEMK